MKWVLKSIKGFCNEVLLKKWYGVFFKILMSLYLFILCWKSGFFVDNVLISSLVWSM